MKNELFTMRQFSGRLNLSLSFTVVCKQNSPTLIRGLNEESD